jgi:hypothetical protein
VADDDDDDEDKYKSHLVGKRASMTNAGGVGTDDNQKRAFKSRVTPIKVTSKLMPSANHFRTRYLIDVFISQILVVGDHKVGKTSFIFKYVSQ